MYYVRRTVALTYIKKKILKILNHNFTFFDKVNYFDGKRQTTYSIHRMLRVYC